MVETFVLSWSGDKDSTMSFRELSHDSRYKIQSLRGVGFAHQCKQVGAENEFPCLNIMRVCTHWEISQTRKHPYLKSESFGRETAKTRETEAINMVDRAGFEPSTSGAHNSLQ